MTRRESTHLRLKEMSWSLAGTRVWAGDLTKGQINLESAVAVRAVSFEWRLAAASA